MFCKCHKTETEVKINWLDSAQKAPIVHDLFDTFLVRNDANLTSDEEENEKSKPVALEFIARPNLEIFRLKYLLPMLELSAVHRETTEGVRITAIPFYMFRRNNESYFVSSKSLLTCCTYNRHWKSPSPFWSFSKYHCDLWEV